MTKLLEKGIEAIKALPAERQDLAGELLLNLAGQVPHYTLTPQQLHDIRLAIEEARQGDFATDKEMADTWNKFGL